MNQIRKFVCCLMVVVVTLPMVFVDAIEQPYDLTEDTFVDGQRPTQNFSTSGQLVVKYADSINWRRQALLKLDLRKEAISDITMAKLRLYVSYVDTKLPDGQTVEVEVFATARKDWNSTTITMQDFPDLGDQTSLGKIAITKSDQGSYVELDITNHAQQIMTQDKIFSFLVQGSDYYVRLNSLENTNKPHLLIDGQVGQPPITEPTIYGAKIEAVQDAYLEYGKNGANQHKNFGNRSELIIKSTGNINYDRKAIICFSIPQNKNQARFYFFNNTAVAATELDLIATELDWTEDEVTWSNSVGQNLPGSTARIGSVTVDKIGWYAVDISEYVSSHYGQQISFYIDNLSAQNSYLKIASREDKEGRMPFVDCYSYQLLEGEQAMFTTYVDNRNSSQSYANHNLLELANQNGHQQRVYLKPKTASNAEAATSAYLRFYVPKDHHTGVQSIQVSGLADATAIDSSLTYTGQPSASNQEQLYTLKVTNKGWYTVDITDYFNRHLGQPIGFVMDLVNSGQIKIDKTVNRPVLYQSTTEDDFDRLRQQFAITKDTDVELNSLDVQRIIKNIDDKIDKEYDKINKEANRTYLFEDYQGVGKKRPTDMRYSYVRLNNMLRAYHTAGSKYEEDSVLYQDILDGLAFLYEHWYNEATIKNGNWWLWEIGVPKVLGETLATVYPDLTPTERMNYCTAIYRFQPDPIYSEYFNDGDRPRDRLINVGANRVDTCIADTILGALTKNPHLIDRSRQALHDVYQYVQTKDGFYIDGSFIQHGDVSYTTAYGIVLVSGLISLYNKLSIGPWAITDPDYQNVYAWLENSFIPLVFNGRALPISSGRSLSRQMNGQEMGRSAADGYYIGRLLYQAANGVEEPRKSQWLGLAKRYFVKNETYDILGNARNMTMIKEYNDLVLNPAITMASDYKNSHVFAFANRVVHHRPNFAAGLAMNSERIQNYEVMNGENLKGWYQGEGALYLLNKDRAHFDDAYWPTVDAYKIPGTTVDTTKRQAVDSVEERNNPAAFVGGTSLDKHYSVAGMDFIGHRTDLKAKKSYFFVKDMIVALGAGISGSKPTETIVANRIINPNDSIQVDHQTQLKLNEQQSVNRSLLLVGQTPDINIGYYFPNKKIDVQVARQQRSGSWSQINQNGSTDEIERQYLIMTINHGTAPVNQSYEYAIAPGISSQEWKRFSTNPGYRVIANNTAIQAIHIPAEQLICLNKYQPEPQTVQAVTIQGIGSIIIDKNKDQVSIAIADPTMKDNPPVELIYPSKGQLISNCSNVQVVNENQEADTIHLKIDMAGQKGQTITFRLQLDKDPATEQVSEPETRPNTEEIEVESNNKNISDQTQIPVLLGLQLRSDKTSVQIADDYRDLQSDSWFFEDLLKLEQYGLIKGYPDQQFRPEAEVSGQELIAILTRIEKGNLAETDDWFAIYRQIIDANHRYDDFTFRFERSLTRQQAIAVCYQWYQAMNLPEGDKTAEPADKFKDWQQIDHRYRDAVMAFAQNGIVKGYTDGSLQPLAPIRRSEMTKLLAELIRRCEAIANQ